jgi:hypothetical protein
MDWFNSIVYIYVFLGWGCITHRFFSSPREAIITGIVSGGCIVVYFPRGFIGNIALSTLTSSIYWYYQYYKYIPLEDKAYSISV